MCKLCENKIYTRNKLDYWLVGSSCNSDIPGKIIYKGTINNYLYSRNKDYDGDITIMLIHYCPVCGEELT